MIETGHEAKNDKSLLKEIDEAHSDFSAEIDRMDLHHREADEKLSEIEALRSDNFNLRLALDSMRSRYDDIFIQYSELKKSFEIPADQDSYLEQEAQYYKERSALTEESNELLENKLAESISPPYTYIKDRQIYWVFKDSHGNPYTWDMPIDIYRSVVEREEPHETLVLRSDHRSDYVVRDHTKFVDTSSLSPWMDEVLEKLTSSNEQGEVNIDSRLIYETWYIASQLTAYSPDMGEDPRWPLETLAEGGGDCEDFAILIASMLKASSQTKDWQIQMVYFDNDHRDRPENVNHVSLFIKTDRIEMFVDRSLDPSQNENSKSVKGWYFDV